MQNTISVGQLRQNPTQMLRDVRSGAVYVVTDRGEPVAQVSSRRPTAWTPSADVDALLRELGSDDAWAREIAEDRTAEEAIDPWVERA